jgi:hypothetical protein
MATPTPELVLGDRVEENGIDDAENEPSSSL